jgi:tetratricopeptide (TPR) repeat protein
LLLVSPAFAAPQILTPSDVTLAEIGRCATVRVAFPFPVRYLRHFPPESGRDLRIQFEPFALSAEDRAALFTRRSYLPPRTPIASLEEIAYEGNLEGRPFLRLAFTRLRAFRVEQGDDFRSFIIVVSAPETMAECAPSRPAPPAERRPAPPPEKPTERRPAPPSEKPAVAPPPAPVEDLARLMDEAGRALTRGDHREAIDLYTRILAQPRHQFSQEAQELLALARERNGQLAEAQAEYERYLQLYPEGEGAERVRQRLAGLLTARAQPPERLREAAPREELQIHGAFSQYYNRLHSTTGPNDTVLTRSLLSTDLDLTIRGRASNYALSSVLSVGYDQDFLDGKGNWRLSRLYFDLLDTQGGLAARVGRQTRSTDGVLGTFDGAVVGYQFLRPLRVNALAGIPVDVDLGRPYNSDRYFYGLSLDLGTFAQHWNFNVFAIQQESAGILDRRAVGGEVRYVDGARSFFSLVDYDISYNELNTFLATLNWIFPARTALNITFDQRKVPTLTTTNALIGQTTRSLSALLNTFSESEVRRLAEDRTATSRSLTVGLVHPFSDNVQVGADLTVTEILGTKASGGVDAFPGSGYDYFFSTQLISSNLLTVGDITILGLRYSDTETIDTVGVSLDTRYPVSQNWRVNPKIAAEYRQRNQGGNDEVRILPALRTDYFFLRRVLLELEGGIEWTPRWVGNDTEILDFFVTIGYRIDF